MDGYHIYDEIGRGQHSMVYKGREKQTVQYVAIKSVDKSKIDKVLQEVRVQHKLNHPNCLRFFKWYETRHHIWLILEFATGGSLLDLLRHDGCLPETAARVFGADLVHALLYLHSNGVLYCDLKPSNILLNEYGVLKLSDFALSMTLDQLSKMAPKSKRRGTPCYMAPELFTEEGVPSVVSDMWSLGVVLYELVIGEPPFVSRSFSELVQLIQAAPLELPPGDELTVPFKNLLRSLLRKDPAKRISWPALLTHEFWEGMPLPSLARVPQNTAYQNYLQTREYVPSCPEEDSDPELDDTNDISFNGIPEEESLRMSANARRNLLRESVDSASGTYLRRSLTASSAAALLAVDEVDLERRDDHRDRGESELYESNLVEEDPRGRDGTLNTDSTASLERMSMQTSVPLNLEEVDQPSENYEPQVSATSQRRGMVSPVFEGDLQLENTDTVLDFEYRPDTPIEGEEEDDENENDDNTRLSKEEQQRSIAQQNRRKNIHVQNEDNDEEDDEEEDELDDGTEVQDSHTREERENMFAQLEEIQPNASIQIDHSATRDIADSSQNRESEFAAPESTMQEGATFVDLQEQTQDNLERPRTAPEESAALTISITHTSFKSRPASADTNSKQSPTSNVTSPNSVSASERSTKLGIKRDSVQEAAAAVLALALGDDDDDDDDDVDDDNGDGDGDIDDKSEGFKDDDGYNEAFQKREDYMPRRNPRLVSTGKYEGTLRGLRENAKNQSFEENMTEPAGQIENQFGGSSVNNTKAGDMFGNGETNFEEENEKLETTGPPESAAEPALEMNPQLEREVTEIGENRFHRLLEQYRFVLIPELVQRDFRGAGEVQALLMDAHDFVVRPIVGNPITTALPVLKYNPRSLPFPNLAAQDAARLNGHELEVFFSQVFRALSSSPGNTASQVIQTLGYLYSLCTTPRLANVIVSSSLVSLLIRLGTKPETVLSGGNSGGLRSPPRSPRSPRTPRGGPGIRSGPVTPPSPPSSTSHAASAFGPDFGSSSAYNATPTNMNIRQHIMAASAGPSASTMQKPHSVTTPSSSKTSLKSQLRKLRVRVAIILAVLVRHATFIAPRLNDEGLLDAFVTFSQDEVLPIRRYGSAGLGELLFYITANSPENAMNSGEGGNVPSTPSSAAVDQWKISGAALKQLSSCLHSEDETIRFFAAKTFENVLSLAPAAEQIAQGAGATSLRFATADVASNLLSATLREKAEHLRSTCAMALAHLVRLNRRLLPRLAENEGWGFIANGLQAVHGSPRIQQAFLNILNLVLHSSSADVIQPSVVSPASPMRVMPPATRLGAERITREALFGRRSTVKLGILRALVQLLSHGQNFVVRSKAIVTLTLFLQHYPGELHTLLDNKLVQIFDRLHMRLRRAVSPEEPSLSEPSVADTDVASLARTRGATGKLRRGPNVDDLIERDGPEGTLMMRRCLHTLVYRLAIVVNEAIAFVTKTASRLAPVVASGRTVTASSPEAGMLQRLGRDSLPLLHQLSMSRALSPFINCSADLIGSVSTLIRVNLNVLTGALPDFQRFILLLAESLAQDSDALRIPDIAHAIVQDLLPALWAASVATKISFETKSWCLRLAIDILLTFTQTGIIARAGHDFNFQREKQEVGGEFNAEANDDEDEDEVDDLVDYFGFEDPLHGRDESVESRATRIRLLQALSEHVFNFVLERVLPRTASLLQEEAPVPLLVINLLCFEISKHPMIIQHIESLGLMVFYTELLPAGDSDPNLRSSSLIVMGKPALEHDASISGGVGGTGSEIEASILAGAKLISSILYTGASFVDTTSLISPPCSILSRAAEFARLIFQSISLDEETRVGGSRARNPVMATQFQQQQQQQLEAVVDVLFPLLQVITLGDEAALVLDQGEVLAVMALAVEHALGLSSINLPSTLAWACWLQPGNRDRKGSAMSQDTEGAKEFTEDLERFVDAPVIVLGDLAVLLEKACACLSLLVAVLPGSARAMTRMLSHPRFLGLLGVVLHVSVQDEGILEDVQSRLAARMHVLELLGRLGEHMNDHPHAQVGLCIEALEMLNHELDDVEVISQVLAQLTMHSMKQVEGE